MNEHLVVKFFSHTFVVCPVVYLNNIWRKAIIMLMSSNQTVTPDYVIIDVGASKLILNEETELFFLI